ncbi:restriction endonuclease subunit S [Parafilimonas sp.]|uniref:restriction endonuclease subunit S n=1 Tax=Parafilimonas sp. TaxID=1969739 RepID=UPI0039E297D5
MIEEQNINQLPKGWKWETLRSVCKELQSGKRPKGGVQGIDSGVPSIGAEHLDVNGGFRFSKIKYVPNEFAMQMKKGIIQKDDIIVVKDGATTGKASFVNKTFPFDFAVINEHVFIIRVTEDVLPQYVFYKIWSSKGNKEILEDFRGAAQGGISSGFVDKVTIPLPPKPTQQAIVSKIEELFSELDKGIEQLKTTQQQLKTYRQSVLKWAFEGKLTNENVNEGELPEGWQWSTIGNISTNVEYGSAAKSKEQGKMPVLRMGNIQNGRFDWEDLVYTDNEDEIKKYLLKKNDVLFNRTNSAELVGKTAIYKGEYPAIFAGYLIRINRIENLINADYLNYYLNTKAAKQYGNTVRSFGVNQSNINGTKLKTYPVPLPPIEEQNTIVQEIESRLSVADKMEESINQRLQQAEALRQSILKKAFEGKLVATDTIEIIKETAKVIPFERKVLAGKIIHLLHDDKYFGLTKFQKIFYLVENFAEVPYETSFIQEMAGPYDKEFTTAFRKEMQEKDWAQEEQRGSITKFIPGENIGSLISNYPAYFRDKGSQITFVLKQLKDKSTHQAELIATLYAVWNNRLIKKQPVKIDMLVEDFFNWSAKKKDEFQKEEVFKTYKWMKEVRFVPKGFGKTID